ncbi:claudin-23 [Gadus chalcogrammus]|uniref:claudin-23 n=1 Tax=Gadus chalcogrammus TaxID=1042646 RepID=UPI0024C4083B|nr:claudin-23 [Gadus chalcogrammus]
MHTPATMVMGIVFAPLGLVLVLTASITPQWREGQARLGLTGPGSPPRSKARGGGGPPGPLAAVETLLLLRSDGLWESCLQVVQSELKQCWPVTGAYRRDPRLRLARGLVLSSLFLCGTGIVLAGVGVRCWSDVPLRGVAALGGFLVVLAGLLSLTALGVYTHNLGRLGVDNPGEGPGSGGGGGGGGAPRYPHLTLRPAGSLYFGWLGSCIQVLGGGALLLSFKRPWCPATQACPELPACPACRSCPELSSSPETEVYEMSC